MAVSYARFKKRTAAQSVSAMLLVVLFPFLACLPADAQVGPLARFDHTVTVIDNIMFFIGGMTENDFYVNEFTTLNLSESWDENGPEFKRVTAENGNVPQVAGHSAVLGGADGKSIVVFGGEMLDEQSPGLLVFDTMAKLWRVPTLQREPTRRYQHSAVSDAGHMIVYGGLVELPSDTSYAADDFWVLDFDTRSFGEWSSFPSSATSPGRRTHHTASIVNGHMIIIGGFDAIGGMTDMSVVYYYDISDMTWSHVETKGEAPTPRGEHSAIVYDGKIVIYGGETNDGEVRDDVAVLDIQTWTWTHPQTSNDPPARSKHSASLVDSKMIVAFGKLSSTIDSGIYVLDLKEWIWSKNFTAPQNTTKPARPEKPTDDNGTNHEPKGDEGGKGKSWDASRSLILGLSAGVAFVCAMVIAAVVFVVYRRRQQRTPRPSSSSSFEVTRPFDPESRHNSNLPLMRNNQPNLLTPPSTPQSPAFNHRRSSSQVRPSVKFDGNSSPVPAAMIVDSTAHEQSFPRNGSAEDIHNVQVFYGPRPSLRLMNPDTDTPDNSQNN